MSMVPTVDYQSLFTTLPGAYIAFLPNDPDFTIAAQTKGHAALSMSQRSTVLGRPVLEVFPDTSEAYQQTGVSQLLESFRKVIRTGKADTLPTLHYDIPDEQGKMATRYWRVTHTPIFGRDQQLELIVQSTEDITEDIAADNQLALAQRQLKDALSVGLIGTWVWDITNDMVVADKNLALMFGLDVGKAATGLPIDVFVNSIHPADRKRVAAEIERSIVRKTNYESEYRTFSQDGSVRWVIARGRVETDESGNPVRFPGVIVDITERKENELNATFLAKASDALASSLDYKKTLKTIAALMVPNIADWCSVQMLDDNNVLQQVAIAHKDPEKVKWARELNERQGPPDMDAPTGVPHVIRTGKSEFMPKITEEMVKAAAKDEEELKLLKDLGLSAAIVVPLKVEGRAIGAITLIATETKRSYTQTDLLMAEELAYRASLAMTNASLYANARRELKERHRLEEQLRKANEKLEGRVRERTKELQLSNVSLERSNRELQDFAYVASHDLQEPLRKIQAFGNLLEKEYTSELGDGVDYLNRMRSAAARMSTLIEDLLSFSRVTTQARPFIKVNLRTIAEEVLGDLETRVSETEGKVLVGSLPTIDADPMQMRQLFQNIIGNALKFHREDVPPVVSIDAKTTRPKNAKMEHCRIVIEDNGVGFEEKYLDRIFAVFQRLHGREQYEGTGIGLAVCRKIVERHHGTITAHSTPGEGSKFIITLPIKQKKETSHES